MVDAGKVFRRRFGALVLGILLWCCLILGQLVNLQVIQGEELQEKAHKMHTSQKEIPALRGKILDRLGRRLAVSVWEPGISADPSVIEDPEATVDALAKALGKGAAWSRALLPRLSNREKRFCYVAKRVTQAQAQGVDKANLKGIYLTRKSWRHYPNNWLSSHLLGFITADGSVAEGLEQSFNQRMQGVAGKVQELRDGRGRGNGVSQTIEEPKNGSDIHLTIDLNIQLFTEDALRRGMARTRAKSITAVVMDPRTGALLAMANLPDFNPNRFSKASVGARKNRAVVDVYEPGSAFKVVTAAAALDTGSISTDQIFYSAEGPIKAHDKRIRNHAPYGPLNTAEVLWHSSNAGAVQMALSMDNKVFYDYIKSFGFGEKTGIDLPAESPGILRHYSEWDKVSPYFLSMGHEISTTPLQMLVALSAVANGGFLVQPFIATEVVAYDGTTSDLRPTKMPVRVIKERTANWLAEALMGVVTRGTAKSAALEDVAVFGKTGTAQRVQGSTYAKNKYNSSFVGFFPAEAPRYGIIVVVHDPKGTKVHGGDVAAPIFAEIGNRIVAYEQVAQPAHQITVTDRVPDWSDEMVMPVSNEHTMPDFTGFGLRNLLLHTRRLGLKLEIKGSSGRVRGQWPQPGSPIPDSRNISVILKEG